MSKKISGAEYPIAKIFSSDFDYKIPSYQRPYAWTVDEAGALFEDIHTFYSEQLNLKEEDRDTYFLGSVVLIKQEGKPEAEVIDGQQRLTTLTILLAAIANMLEGKDRSDYHEYICEPGRTSQGLPAKPRLTLRERDREFFRKYVQDLNFEKLLKLDKANLDNESQRNIHANSELLIDQLRKRFGNDTSQISVFGSFIVQRCYLVAVSTPTQQSAFRVFSVLNDRGLDLLPTDIIKAEVIGKLPDDKQDELTQDWEELEIKATRDGFNDLFSHIRMIYAKTKAKKGLLEEFRTFVLTEEQTPEIFLNEVLEPFAEAYLIARHNRYTSTQNAEEVNYYLKWLNRIDNSDWLPSVIKFLSQKKDDPVYVLWFIRRLERLASYLHVCAKNVNQRIERYAKVLAALETEHNYENPISEVELEDDEIDEFLTQLDGKVYELTPRRRNYLILRLDSFISDGAATYDPNLLTIEHVLPQSPPEESEWCQWWEDEEERKLWLHKIANLVPLTRKRNSAAQNYDFETKKRKYFRGKDGVTSFALTSQVLNEQKWTPEVVSGRQDNLLDIFKERWNLNKQ